MECVDAISAEPRFARWRSLVLLCLVTATAAAGGPDGPTARPAVTRPQGLATLPAAARGIVSARLGASDRAFWPHRTAAGAAFADLRSGIAARVSSAGADVRAGRVSWAIGLQALGRGDRVAPVGPASLHVHANRVTLERRGAVEERYADGPLGLEQAFTLGRRPDGPAHGRVVLALGKVPPGVRAVVTGDGTSMSLRNDGREVLRYWGLVAADAHGRPLPARIVLAHRALTLRIDDRRASYPVRIDPFVQTAKLTASNAVAGDSLGTAIAVSDDTIAIGAPSVASARGAVYVFAKPAGGWANATQTATLTASDGAVNNLLGSSVAISGTTIVAGSPHATVSGNQAQGAAYVFDEPAGGWADGTETSKLTAADGSTSDQFGGSVAIDSGTIVVGAQFKFRSGLFGQGAAYVFVNGAQAAKLLASDGTSGDNFGTSVGVSGSTVVVGAPSARNFQGAVYAFVEPPGGWADGTETAELLASDGAPSDRLGFSASVSGDTIAAGATAATAAGHRAGAVYVFVKPQAGWSGGTQTAKLSASDAAAADELGWSVDVQPGTIVAGAPGSGGNQGALYVFAKPAGGWADATQSAKLVAADGAGNDRLGDAVAVTSDGSTAAGGAADASSGAGAAYVFTSGGGARPTSTAVSCVPGSAMVGQATTCTATVTDTGNGAPAAPSGSVSFGSDSDGAFGNPGTSCVLAQVSAATASCHVDYTPSAVDSGSHAITGTYSGDGAHIGGAGNATVTVTPAGVRPTSTSLSCVPASTTVGSRITCGALVTDTGSGTLVTPTGTVSFSSDSPGTFSSGSCSLIAVNAATAACVANYTPAAVDSGTHTLTAAYGGDAAHSSSTGRATVTVTAPSPAPPPPPPAPAPKPNPPQNTTPPSIHPAQSCQFLILRRVCSVIPYEYSCDPGQWTGNDPAAPYAFEWQQLYYVNDNGLLRSFWQTEPGGSAQIFSAFQHVTPDVASGLFRCLVTATGPGGSTVANSAAVALQVGLPLPSGIRWPTPVNVIVTGIEVTQAVQAFGCAGCKGSLPSRDQLNSNTRGQATYQGVTLAAGKFTVVRVYAHVLSGSVNDATAQLEVLDANGNRISVLPADTSPATLTALSCSYCVTAAERANPSSSFNFLVPWQETNRPSLTFRATVTPPSGPAAAASGVGGQCGGCLGNVFTLSAVPFVPTATIPIYPIPLTVGGSSGACGTPLALRCTRQSPQQVFEDADALLPQHLEIFPYRPPLNVGSQNSCQAAATVSVQGAQDNLGAGDYGVGVFPSGEGNLQNGCTLGKHTLFVNGAASAVQDDRTVTSVTHEMGHALSLVHADTGSNCVPYTYPGTSTTVQSCAGPHPDKTADCGGNANGQIGEQWPPNSPSDNEGRLDGIGLDRRLWNVGATGSLPSTFVEGYSHTGAPTADTTAGARYYDFMSYCPSGGVTLGKLVGSHYQEPLDWISLANWNTLLAYPPPAAARVRARRLDATEGTPLRVLAIIDSAGKTSIFSVAPGEQTLGVPPPDSVFRMELRDGAGKVLDSVVPTTGAMHIDFTGQGPQVLLDATLPFAPATASVDVTEDGRMLTHRARSAHAPTASFVAPRPGTLVGRQRTTLVRWTERDADADPLSATVEYSADGGRRWEVVAGPLTGTSARVPSRFLSASSDARLRVRVSDGFDVATAASGKLRALGAPPVVQIIDAPRRGQVPATAMLLLRGSAFDDANRPLTGRHLRWYLGKRLIGTGEQVTARNLPAGRTTIRLVATDSHGRSAEASRPLRIRAVAARYLVFDPPLLVSRRARTAQIEISASSSATFLVASRRFAVGPRLRTVAVHIRPGSSLLILRCVLRSPGGVIRGRFVVLR